MHPLRRDVITDPDDHDRRAAGTAEPVHQPGTSSAVTIAADSRTTTMPEYLRRPPGAMEPPGVAGTSAVRIPRDVRRPIGMTESRTGILMTIAGGPQRPLESVAATGQRRRSTGNGALPQAGPRAPGPGHHRLISFTNGGCAHRLSIRRRSCGSRGRVVAGQRRVSTKPVPRRSGNSCSRLTQGGESSALGARHTAEASLPQTVDGVAR